MKIDGLIDQTNNGDLEWTKSAGSDDETKVTVWTATDGGCKFVLDRIQGSLSIFSSGGAEVSIKNEHARRLIRIVALRDTGVMTQEESIDMESAARVDAFVDSLGQDNRPIED